MTDEQRRWTIEAITKAMPLVIFQHEEVRLETMLAKYSDPRTVIEAGEFREDICYLDKIYD